MIENPQKKKINFDRDLTALFGLSFHGSASYRLKTNTIINRLFSFNNFIINCDLIDKNENFFNEKPSNVLACFDIKGSPFETVVYSSKNSPFRKIAGGKKTRNT